MIYNVIGLMSGSSLDGLDIAFVQLTETRGQWAFELLAAECVAYEAAMEAQLRNAASLTVPEFLKLNTRYGHFLGSTVKAWMDARDLTHTIHFIASHGHTVFHDPVNGTTAQIGCGAAIAAEAGLPVISDLRAMDVAFGGQGAPIVPIGDRLLFPAYDFWLNLGGIANITAKRGDAFIAFDICPCNQVLNALIAPEGKPYDAGGARAAEGMVNQRLLAALHANSYYSAAAPKSLANEFATDQVLPLFLADAAGTVADNLATAVAHIAGQITAAVLQADNQNPQPARLLATGGGAMNTFLIQEISRRLAASNISVEVPDEQVVHYKEAIIMALIGALRWREEPNVLSSVTGARQDSVGGALWMNS